MHRHLPLSLRADLQDFGQQRFAQLSARLRALSGEGLVQLGPMEPVVTREGAAENTRMHLWVIGDPELDHRELRVQLGRQGLALRLHFMEYGSHVMAWLGGINCAPVDAMALSPYLADSSARALVAAIRARRERRRVPLFVCDNAYDPQTSRELYAAGTNGYLCGGAATRQLGAALLRLQRRQASAQGA